MIFNSLIDQEERKMLQTMFSFAKEMIDLDVTESELALLCSVMLIDCSEYLP